ncbi:unnamed protein product [Moneuplotes crassus]|uniref:Uncharacterized protein n=2 Tax=Euplotes crassus TaxID=5936 RepID=A0AAD1UNW8_EUPCR|nr:unnamed protein product [Moneuplotes crassus]
MNQESCFTSAMNQMMTEVYSYMTEIISLYESHPTPPISLTSLVKACEVVNLCNMKHKEIFRHSKSGHVQEFTKTQARFMLIIVKEFFKIKNERPEEFVENYEDALKLSYLQEKYNQHMKQNKVKERQHKSPPRKIIKTRKSSKKRKTRNKKSIYKSYDNVLNIVPQDSGKKHHYSQKILGHSQDKYDRYSEIRHPNDPFPDIRHLSRRNRSKKNKSKRRKLLKSRNESQHKSSNDIQTTRMNPIEEQYLRKSKSTYMNSGWGINPRKFKQVKSKSTLKGRSEMTQDTSPKSRRLVNHKSYQKMKVYKDAIRDTRKRRPFQPQTQIIESDYEESDADSGNWIAGGGL